MKEGLRRFFVVARLHAKLSLMRNGMQFTVLFQPFLTFSFFYLSWKSGRSEVSAWVSSWVSTASASLIAASIFGSAGDLDRDRQVGLLESVVASPMGLKAFVGVKVLTNAALSLLGALVLLGLIWTVNLGAPTGSGSGVGLWLPVALLLLLLQGAALGLLLVSLFSASRFARRLMNYVEHPLLIVCGVAVPLGVITPILSPLGAYMPLSSLSPLLEGALGAHPDATFMWGWVLRPMCSLVVTAGCGGYFLGRLERRYRETSNLSKD